MFILIIPIFRKLLILSGSLILSGTAGFDSSSGHLNPHQKSVEGSEDSESAQCSVMTTVLNIIQFESLDKKFIWRNSTPQSPRLARILRMCFEKEDNDAIDSEINRLKSEVLNLYPHSFNLNNGQKIAVTFKITLTLSRTPAYVDGRASHRSKY